MQYIYFVVLKPCLVSVFLPPPVLLLKVQLPWLIFPHLRVHLQVDYYLLQERATLVLNQDC